jgi:hypothetical protein
MRHRPGHLLAVLALTAAGCGGGDGERAPAPDPRPVAQAERFPEAKGRRLRDVLEGVPEGPRLWAEPEAGPAGRDRVEFAVLDDARKPLAGAEVALYVARGDGSGARGPFVARPARGVRYRATVAWGAPGRHALVGVAKLDGRLVATRPLVVEVRR